MLALLLSVALVAVACSSGSDSKGGSGGGSTTAPAKNIDYKAIGLWDDGPCDTAKPPLKLGLMTVFQSPVISLEDQAKALEASAKAFNKRGGANGSCIEVTTCDDGANVDQAVGMRADDRQGRRRGNGQRPGNRWARPRCRRPWPRRGSPESPRT